MDLKNELQKIVDTDPNSEFFINYYSKLSKFPQVKQEYIPLIFALYKMSKDKRLVKLSETQPPNVSGMSMWGWGPKRPEMIVKSVQVHRRFFSVEFVRTDVEDSGYLTVHWRHLVSFKEQCNSLWITYKSMAKQNTALSLSF